MDPVDPTRPLGAAPVGTAPGERRPAGIGVRCRGLVHLYRTVEGHDVVALQGVDLTSIRRARAAELRESAR
jgi:putative ABC transport system ATP-binding protein